MWALHRPDLTNRRVPHHHGAVVPAHPHPHEERGSTRQHPPPAANTVPAQDSLLLSNQERYVAVLDQAVQFLGGRELVDAGHLGLFMGRAALAEHWAPIAERVRMYSERDA